MKVSILSQQKGSADVPSAIWKIRGYPVRVSLKEKQCLLAALSALALFCCSSVLALDTVFFVGGEKQAGKVLSMDDETIRLRILLPTPPGAEPAFADVGRLRKDIAQVEFEPDPSRDQLLNETGPDNLAALETLWGQWKPFLSLPKSPAGRIANIYGDLLLRTRDDEKASQALELFQHIENEAWDENSKMQARQGRLRAMVATGQASSAVQEAMELARVTENPAVLIEAKFILAQAADHRLRELVEENPRWEEDVFVIPERHRLYNEALDEYLYPYLFLGSEQEAAARGLWGAIGIYRFANELSLALECARDLVTIYPDSPQATQAKEFIASLPEEMRSSDPEKEARENLSPETNEPNENET